MVTLKELHEFAVEAGIEEDPRDREIIEKELEQRNEAYEDIEGVREEQFDEDRLENPYDDSKVIHGGDSTVSKLAVGIDMETPELLLVDQMNQHNDAGIDGVIGHHPTGRALARLHDVMSLQIDTLRQAGVPVSQAESMITARASKVHQGVHPINHMQVPNTARHLDIPMACMHTITDNHAHTFTEDYLAEEEPRTLQDIVDALLELEEHAWELGYGLGPEVFAGTGDNRAGEIGVLGYTGGTDSGDEIVDQLLDAGVDTLIAMHAPRKTVKKAQEKNMRVISTGHMASDSLGMNLFLDKATDEFDLEFAEFSGFKRVDRR